ncbi:MAG: hypothetical protein V4692_03370, partial [Bdellovibrionota bacterium]
MNTRGIFLSTILLTLAAGCAPKPDTGVQGSWRSNCVEGSSAALVGQADIGVTQYSHLSISEGEVVETSFVTSSSCD